MLTEAELIEIEHRCQAATPGAWKSYVENRSNGDEATMINIGSRSIRIMENSTDDLNFIVHAREDGRRLLAEVRRVKNGLVDPQSLTDVELSIIEQRCQSAASLPWDSSIEGRDHTSGDSIIFTGDGEIYLVGCAVADQDFIAHARQDIPALISEIRSHKI